MKEKLKIILIFLPIILAISIFILIPREEIYIKEIKKINVSENINGLIEAYRWDIVYSFGNLINKKQEFYSVEIGKFNSSESAQSFFSIFIEKVKDANMNLILNENEKSGKISYSMNALFFVEREYFILINGQNENNFEKIKNFIKEKL